MAKKMIIQILAITAWFGAIVLGAMLGTMLGVGM